jgi:hypothetical protein
VSLDWIVSFYLETEFHKKTFTVNPVIFVACPYYWTTARLSTFSKPESRESQLTVKTTGYFLE